jgi:hypothetical protein
MSNLGLNRKILSDIANGNQEAIKALERVFGETNIALPEQIASAINQAATAIATANQALGLLAEVVGSLEYLANAPANAQAQEFEDMRPAIQLGSISIQEADNVDITGGTAGLSAGTVALPSFYLVDRATGLYRIGLDNWGLSINAVKLLDFQSLLLQVVGRVRIDTGTLAAPALYFGAETGTGLYRIGVNNWGMAIAGVKLVDFSSALVAITGALTATGQITTSIATGTAPFVVTSTTKVSNLYVDRAALADTATALASPSAFPAAATDLPTVITLANALRTAAIAKGL